MRACSTRTTLQHALHAAAAAGKLHTDKPAVTTKPANSQQTTAQPGRREGRTSVFISIKVPQEKPTERMNRGRQQTSSSCSSSSGGGKLTTHTTSSKGTLGTTAVTPTSAYSHSNAPTPTTIPLALLPFKKRLTRASHGSPASFSRPPFDFARISGTRPCFSGNQDQGSCPCPAQIPLTQADQTTVQQQQQPSSPEAVLPMHSNEISNNFSTDLKWSLSSNAMHSQLPHFPGLQSGLAPLQDIAPSTQTFPPSGSIMSQPETESFEEHFLLPVSTSMYSTPTPSPTASTSAEAGSWDYGQQGMNLLPVQPREYPNLGRKTPAPAHPNVCPVKNCGYSSSVRRNLTRHIRWHKEQKPFKCKKCKYSFSQSSDLKRHVLIHTGERPFSCKMCGRKFARSDNTKKHAKVHMKQCIKKEAKMTTSKAPLPSSSASTSSQAAPSTSHSSISDSSFLSTTLPLVVTTASL